jgi:DNA-binding MarR family transcriptional regulator
MPAKPTIGFNISWIARMQRTRFDARVRVLGLTRAQWTMMVTIRLSEGATQSELASNLEINTVTAGRIIDRLEAAGWTERRPDPIDRRVNRLYLTPEAMPMLGRLSVVGGEEEHVALAGFSTEEQATLSNLLERMIANLRDRPPPCVEVADDDELVAGSTLPADHR